MLKYIRRIDGKFIIDEFDYLNMYYKLIHRDVCYAYIHIQLATVERLAYCHFYVERFTAEIAREIKKDLAIIINNIRAFDISTAVGTKTDGIKLWKKFVKLMGVKDEDIVEATFNSTPCMMAVMEL